MFNMCNFLFSDYIYGFGDTLPMHKEHLEQLSEMFLSLHNHNSHDAG